MGIPDEEERRDGVKIGSWNCFMQKKRGQSRFKRSLSLVWVALLLGVASCSSPIITKPALQATAGTYPGESPSPTPSSPPISLPTAGFTATVAQAIPTTSIATLTGTPIQSPTETPTPTYIVLRGEVLQLSNCRYGPGAPYLYKYGLVAGSNLEVIGRNEDGTWILVQAIGGNNPCWVKASLMEVKGDVTAVAPAAMPLPLSPYYGPPSGVFAARVGNEVAISWIGIQLRAGDDSEQFPYLVETWVCKDGQLVFIPLGSYETLVKINDEPGCSEPSHARVYAVEKHGYTRWVEVSWPPQD